MKYEHVKEAQKKGKFLFSKNRAAQIRTNPFYEEDV